MGGKIDERKFMSMKSVKIAGLDSMEIFKELKIGPVILISLRR